MTDTNLMHEMSWPEIEAARVGGRTTAILACGAVEQHGPHLPTGTDDYLGTAIAERAAELAGNALVAPTLRPGLSEHHMHFSGSFTLRPSTFVALLEDYCHSLARQGFERILVFASHGGNTDTIRACTPALARELYPRCQLVAAVGGEWFQRVIASLTARDVPLARAGVHAGFAETSMMLAYRGNLVEMELAEPGRCDEDFYLPENLANSQIDSFIHGIQTQSANGILGDPTGATAKIGEELVNSAAASLAEILAAAEPATPSPARA